MHWRAADEGDALLPHASSMRPARPAPIPPRATEMFDVVGEAVSKAAEALRRSETESGFAGNDEHLQLRLAVAHLLKAVDTLIEGVIAMHDRR